MPLKTARIWLDNEIGAYRIQTPYNIDFVYEFKAMPAPARSWDAANKLWYFSPEWLDYVKKLCIKYFGEVMMVDTVVANDTADMAAKFLKLIGIDNATAAYKRAAANHHPDKGGDPEKMQELNKSWQELKKTLFPQNDS